MVRPRAEIDIDAITAKAQFAIPKLMEKHAHECALVIVADGKEIYRWGELKTLRWDGIYRYMFFDQATRAETVASIETASMPQTHAQGAMRCLLLVPEPGVLVALFGETTAGPVEYHKEAQSVWDELRSTWQRSREAT